MQVVLLDKAKPTLLRNITIDAYTTGVFTIETAHWNSAHNPSSAHCGRLQLNRVYSFIRYFDWKCYFGYKGRILQNKEYFAVAMKICALQDFREINCDQY